MFARTIRRKDLVKRDYHPNAYHWIQANGVEVPMHTITSGRFPTTQQLDSAFKESVMIDIKCQAFRNAKFMGLYGDDEFYAVDTWEPMWMFVDVGGKLFVEGRVDVVIPFRQILDF